MLPCASRSFCRRKSPISLIKSPPLPPPFSGLQVLRNSALSVNRLAYASTSTDAHNVTKDPPDIQVCAFNFLLSEKYIVWPCNTLNEQLSLRNKSRREENRRGEKKAKGYNSKGQIRFLEKRAILFKNQSEEKNLGVAKTEPSRADTGQCRTECLYEEGKTQLEEKWR